MPPTKESGSGEAIALASNLTYEPTPDEIQRASDLILSLVAERDALREALERIAAYWQPHSGVNDILDSIAEIARAALDGTK